MSRVWKKFLQKLVEPVSIFAYVGLTFFVGDYFRNIYGDWGFVAAFAVMIIIPGVAFIIKEMWLSAKREVEFENQELMRQIKGK